MHHAFQNDAKWKFGREFQIEFYVFFPLTDWLWDKKHNSVTFFIVGLWITSGFFLIVAK